MNLTERDLKVIWHPYTQMQTAAPPIPIVRGEGSVLFAEDGKQYIDAVSSWWVNIHGHSHPYIAAKVAEQLLKLEHVIFAGFTHEALLNWPSVYWPYFPIIKRSFSTPITAPLR